MISSKWRKWILLLIDICVLIASNVIFFVLTCFKEGYHAENLINFYLLNLAIMLLSFFIFRTAMKIYSNVWRYPNTKAYIKLILSDVFAGVVSLVISLLVGSFNDLRQFLYTISFSTLFSLSLRFGYRMVYKRSKINKRNNDKEIINVAIIGAGRLGVALVNELVCNYKSIYHPMFFIDVDEAKIGGKVVGLKVFGPNEDVKELMDVYNIREIIIAVSNMDHHRADYLYDLYSKTGRKVKIYDTPLNTVEGKEDNKRVIREFQIEDLLFRQPLSIKDSGISDFYDNKCILVTGGGGSIGSELCRQISLCNPKKLIIFDIYENNAYEIQQELIRKYGNDLNLVVEIGSVRDKQRLESIFKNYDIDIVFHAAAHKHVPLMEQSGCEAIKNNVLGTYNTANLAEKYGVKNFILISTDKAVNPTNIMGASKRLCEMVIQSRNDSKTVFSAVRFGNVLGSNGSVIPLFKKQISNGGPVTITDKRIIRYFMTIPEASQLVMRAGAMAKCGELFVLDMGKPVRIYDLAVNMIKLSGFEPDTEIKIQEIGLRPGEKLYEELLMKTETLDKTDDDMIFIERDTPLTRAEMEAKLDILYDALESSREEIGSDKIKKAIIKTVPTFHNPEEVNSVAESSDEMKATVSVTYL